MNTRLLTKEELNHFNEYGYVVAEDVIPHDLLDAVASEIEETIDSRADKLHRRGELSRLYEDEGFDTRLAKISSETDKLALSIWSTDLHGPAFFSLFTDDSLVNCAEQLVGPEIIMSSVYRLRPKIPNYGYGEVPWHQDSGYMEPFCDDFLIPTFWIPLIDADEENGCMWVLPKTHTLPVIPHMTDKSGTYLQVVPEVFPKVSKRVACPVKKGGILLLTNKTLHASFKNKTDKVRWALDLRYQSAEAPTNAAITRFDDEFQASAEKGIPAACLPSEPDFLVRSRKRPAEVMTSAEEFAKLRENHVPIDVTNRFKVEWTAVTVDDF